MGGAETLARPHRLHLSARSRFNFIMRLLLRLLLVILPFVSPLIGQTPDIIVVYKGPGYRQTGPDKLEPYRPGIAAVVSFPSAVPAGTTVQLVGPSVSIPLSRVDSDYYFLEQYFPTEAAMDSTMPTGSYRVVVTSPTGGGSSTSFSVLSNSSSGLQPTKFSNYDELQNWTGGPLNFRWDPIANGTRDDVVSLTVDRTDGTSLYESPTFGSSGALDGTSTSVTVPSLNLAAGETALAQLTFVKLDISFANNYATIVASGRGFFLTTPITRAALTKPTITIQPRTQTVATGSSVAFWVGASGGDLRYQWRRNGVPIDGATNATYVVTNAQSGPQAFYTVDVSNSGGSATSEAASFTAVPATANAGRISNLAIRSQAGSGDQTLIVGVAVGGSGTTGPKPLLLRGIGPGLAAFNVPGTLGDPKLEVFSNGSKVLENDDWRGDAQVASFGAQLGAFALSPTSRDAALYSTAFTSGSYTVQITGAAGTKGVALAEIYDATPGTALTLATPRLTNVSARTQVGTGGDILIAGFAISGETSKTLLIRAVGATLGTFGVPGALVDSKLEIYSGTTLVHANDNWGGDATLASIFRNAGAFALSANSSDAALVVTLPPGSYTAQVSGVNSATGVALVEIYEAP
jgi:hypothetical protein